MIRKLLLSATAFTALSGAALAADLPARVAAPMYAPPVFTWTGFYVGASAGYVKGSTSSNEAYAYPDSTVDYYSWKNAVDGGIFGVDVGYNLQMGAMVLGLEADISGVAARSSTSPYGDSTYTSTTKIQSIGTVRGRLGLAVDRALLYVTGGLAYADVKHSYSYYDSTDYDSSTSGWKTGWTFGAGVEYALAPNWTIRAEGLYVDVGKRTYSVDYNDGYSDTFSHKTTALIARVGVNYKF